MKPADREIPVGDAESPGQGVDLLVAARVAGLRAELAVLEGRATDARDELVEDRGARRPVLVRPPDEPVSDLARAAAARAIGRFGGGRLR